MGQKNILSPHKELNLRPSDSALRCSTPELKRLYVEQGLLQRTRVLHSAKISNFDSVILCKWNKKDGNFRLGEGNFSRGR